ncbi:MAG: hypothetical protein K2X66_11545, partial [Cyanobacteria bacterium]|nr:hypothetical protein [Cyanobacteriota bacterium]
GFGLNLFISGFTLFFSLFAKPWIANQPHTDEAIGIGAFNLVRVGAYQKTGGHQRIPLCVDDDIKLGKLLKKKGCSQRILYGVDMVKVDWYGSIPDMIQGLSKNAFAGVGFQEWMVVWTVVSQLLFIFPPYVGVFYTTGWTQILFAASILLITVICYDNNLFHGLNQRIGILAGLLFPVSSTLMMISVVNSCLKTLKIKGIYWRETFYPLPVLKQGLQTFSNHLKEPSPDEGISRESL